MLVQFLNFGLLFVQRRVVCVPNPLKTRPGLLQPKEFQVIDRQALDSENHPTQHPSQRNEATECAQVRTVPDSKGRDGLPEENQELQHQRSTQTVDRSFQSRKVTSFPGLFERWRGEPRMLKKEQQKKPHVGENSYHSCGCVEGREELTPSHATQERGQVKERQQRGPVAQARAAHHQGSPRASNLHLPVEHLKPTNQRTPQKLAM